MFEQTFGAAQIAALLILLQRGLEEIYSARNTRALLAAGGREAGRDYYPVVAITHLAWIAALFLLIPADAPILWPLQRRAALALSASAALYAAVWEFQWNLPAYPNGHWYFNPFAWQLLFVFGAWCALGGADRLAGLLRSKITIVSFSE